MLCVRVHIIGCGVVVSVFRVCVVHTNTCRHMWFSQRTNVGSCRVIESESSISLSLLLSFSLSLRLSLSPSLSLSFLDHHAPRHLVYTQLRTCPHNCSNISRDPQHGGCCFFVLFCFGAMLFVVWVMVMIVIAILTIFAKGLASLFISIVDRVQ